MKDLNVKVEPPREITFMDINDIKPNILNPRTIDQSKYEKLVKSIKRFPTMLSIRPIVIDKDNVILGGNMRYKACKEAGLESLPILKVDNLTAKEKDEFIIKDNVGFGEWDWEMINDNWDIDEVTEWGLDVPKLKDDVTDLSDSLETSLKIEVDCTSEEQQETLFNELIEQGYECRLLTL